MSANEKKPRLFYFEEAVDAWIPAPEDVAGIIESDQLDAGEERDITFRRMDMTDEELSNLPED